MGAVQLPLAAKLSSQCTFFVLYALAKQCAAKHELYQPQPLLRVEPEHRGHAESSPQQFKVFFTVITDMQDHTLQTMQSR